MSLISQKICLVGDFSVGKTSLIRRFVEGKFSDRYLSTVGVKISRKMVDIIEENQQQMMQLLIWDIEGNTKFKAIAPSYLQGAKGAIIVGDVTRNETIESIHEHLNLFLSINPKGLSIIALNKSDLSSQERLERLLELHNFSALPQVIRVCETSAKMGENVDEIFQQLAIGMIDIK